MHLYFYLLLGFAIAPSVLLLIVNGQKIDPKVLFISVGILAVIGIIWDTISVDLGIWQFFPAELIGVWIGSLPIEEYVFMIFVPLLVINMFVLMGSMFFKVGRKETFTSASGDKISCKETGTRGGDLSCKRSKK